MGQRRQQGKPGSIGHSKHRKAFGTQPVRGRTKAAVEREANREKPRRPEPERYDSVEELMRRRKE